MAGRPRCRYRVGAHRAKPAADPRQLRAGAQRSGLQIPAHMRFDVCQRINDSSNISHEPYIKDLGPGNPLAYNVQ
jgi:hypothetical protein